MSAGGQPARTPRPPYHAVLFTTTRRAAAPDDGYDAMAKRMEQLAAEQPGYLGMESVRGADGLGITISYWTDRAAAQAWRAVAEHRGAQALGRERWYARFVLRHCSVHEQLDFDAGQPPAP